MEKKTIAFFGASGGLGEGVIPKLSKNYNIIELNSKILDITDFAAVKKFFDENTIDIVINFSGYNYDSVLHKYTTDKLHEIDKQVDVNIKGTINILSTCIGGMRDRGYGRIVLASSILAEHPVKCTSIYAGCKGFIDSVAKVAALENAGKGINCNSIQLGYFDAGLLYKIPESIRESIREQIPTKRWGSMDEL